jgi:hypothetical protein
MQWYRGPEGDQRIWFEPEDIERIAEDELRRAGLMPTLAEPVTDVERFIEGHLNAELDQYAELPDDVLGLTRFEARRRPYVSISGSLTDATEAGVANGGLLGRWRATMAHEAMHILLHRYLFDPDMAELVTARAGEPPHVEPGGLMRCLHRDVVPVTAQAANQSRQRADWREVQANRGMAALLMPSRLFQRIAFRQMTNLGAATVSVGSAAADDLATRMANTFMVSKQAAMIRLETLEVCTLASGD